MTLPWPRAFTILSIAALVSCGGGGGGGPSDTPPSVNFSLSCVDLSCTFTNTSSDLDTGDSIVSSTWTFGDGSAAVTTSNATHTYAAGNAYIVGLTVTDRSGTASSLTRTVAVTAPAVPAAPHAAFALACSSLDCTFTDTSTYDPGSVLQSRLWDFGDGSALAATNPATHHFSADTIATFTVTLTVTDTAGKASTRTQTVPVAPPATTLNCVGGGCVLSLTQAASVTATLVSHSCSAHGTAVVVTAPITQTIVTDGCFAAVGTAVSLDGGTIFAANTVLQVSVLSGLLGATAPVFAPSIRVAGDFTKGWTLSFDDGFGGPGEPDFNDLVILVKATP